MESLWIFGLYILVPVLALGNIIYGLAQLKRTRSYRKVRIGLILLTLPFLHKTLEVLQIWRHNQVVVGQYYAPNDTVAILTIHENGMFESEAYDSIIPFGTGKWEIIDWDIVELNLTYDSPVNQHPFFEISNGIHELELRYDPWSKRDFRLIKK